MRESRFKSDLIEQAQISNGNSLLDVGCGTGTLATITKQLHPEAEVIGIDADSKILGIARAKAAKTGIKLTFDQGMADQLPYADSSFVRVLSSLFLHHLSTENKLRTLREVLRVLRTGGRFDVVDLGPPRTFYSRLVARFTVNNEEVAANLQGLLPEMFREGADGPGGIPRWVKVFGLIGLGLVLLVVILKLTGHGPGSHTP